MEEKKIVETAHHVSQLWAETSQALVQSAFDIQGRSLHYIQNSFKDGLETFQSNITTSQDWFRTAQRLPEHQDAVPSLMESRLEIYKRNIAYVQRVTEQGTETLKANNEVIRDLTQHLISKAQ